MRLYIVFKHERIKKKSLKAIRDEKFDSAKKVRSKASSEKGEMGKGK